MNRTNENLNPVMMMIGLFLTFNVIANVGCNSEVASKKDKKHSDDTQTENNVNVLAKDADEFHAKLEHAGKYVGSNVCRECHAEIAKLYDNHPMGNSASLVNSENVVEDYTEKTSFQHANGIRYEVDRKQDNTTFHRSYRMLGDLGQTYGSTSESTETFFDIQRRVDITIGSGRRGRTYLYRVNDLLFESPITWYTQTNQWDLSPGYEIKNQHFERQILDGCVACHVGQIKRNEDGQPNRFINARLDSGELLIEAGIGCERCHGPGEHHVAFQRGKNKGRKADPILKIAELKPHLRESVCNQCHFIGAEQVLRYGRSEYDFRPGFDISDVWVKFVKGDKPQESAAEAVSHVEQMHASKCFQNSAGKLGCISCHDPHKVPSEIERVNFYRGKCLNCHTQPQTECSVELAERKKTSPQDSCIQCHMPTFEASDIAHTTQTDHRVFRKPRQQSLENYNEGKLAVFANGKELLPKEAIERAKAFVMSRTALEWNSPQLANRAIEPLESIVAGNPDDINARYHLGMMYQQTNELQRAQNEYQSVLKEQPNHLEAIKSMGILLHDSGQHEAALNELDRYLAINPNDRSAVGRKIHLLGLLNRVPEGIALAEKAVNDFPGHWQVHQWLAQAYELTGENEQASRHRKLYELLKPATVN